MIDESNDRVASDYYREVGAQAIPTPEQERELFTQYRAARDANRRTLAERLKGKIACGYLKFVVKRAHRRTKNRELRLDLISEGNIGLMVAIDKFDVDRGTRFLTYGAAWIDVYMREFINKSLGVHMPNHKRKEYRRVRAAEEKLIAQGIIREHSVSEPTTTSLENVTLTATDDVEKMAHDRRLNVLDYLVDAGLSDRDRYIVIHHFGLRGGEPKNFRDLTGLLYLIDGVGRTTEEVREIVEGAIVRLNEHLQDEGIASADDLL